MTDLTQPAATDESQVALPEVEIQEEQTLESLTESISKLEANKNAILLEKRALATASQTLQSKLDHAVESASEANAKYEALLLDTAKNSLLAGIAPTADSREYLSYLVKDFATIENGVVSFKDKDGNIFKTASDLAKSIRENKEYAAHILAFPDANGLCGAPSGAGSLGDGSFSGSSSRNTSSQKQQSNQFGLK